MKDLLYIGAIVVLVLIMYMDNKHKEENECTFIVEECRTESVIATVTGYTNRPEETNDCELTAIMEEPVVGWTVAVSRDLAHWLGGRVYIETLGVRRVNDLMNKRFEKSVDIYMGRVSEARTFGRKELLVVYLGK